MTPRLTRLTARLALLACVIVGTAAAANPVVTGGANSFSVTGLDCGLTYSAQLGDNLGNTWTINADTDPCADATSPTSVITAPAGGATVAGSVSVSADATDSDGLAPPREVVSGVRDVQFKLDGANLGAADSSAPFGISWDTLGVADGTHVLTALATDNAGNSTTSAAVSVTVQNGPAAVPSIPSGFTAEAGNGQATLTWNANPAGDQVDLYQDYKNDLNDNLGIICTTQTCSYTVNGLTNGTTYSFRVSAHNARGYGMWTAPISVTPVAPIVLGSALPARMPVESPTAPKLVVTSNGSGSSACTVAAPCSLTRAFALAANGYVIQARAGTYGTQTITNKTYSATNPVTLTSYPGDAMPSFNGPASLPGSATNGFYLGAVTGLRIRGVKFQAIYAVTCLKIDSSTDIEVVGSVFANCGNSNGTTGGGTGGQGILVGMGFDGVTPTTRLQVWDNTFYNWSNAPQDTGGHGHGMYLGVIRASVVANNLLYGTTQKVGHAIQLGGGAVGTIVTNNTMDGVIGRSAVVVWTSATSYGPIPTADNLIVNNLVTNNGDYGIRGCGGPVPTIPNIARSNGFYNNVGGDYNTATCAPTFNATFTVQAPTYDVAQPFVNRTARDYHLLQGNGARDVAEPQYAPPFDKDGVARDTTPNLGAY